LEDSFQATHETVSFENRNGKKFTYLIADLDRSLREMWNSKELLHDLLQGDWGYDEVRYRNAFATLFKDQEWNAVASNLGSQTANTVRCLELYAYFKLQKEPTVSFSRPDVLYWGNLDPIFSQLDIKSRFEDWLKTEKDLKPKSVSHYSSAVSGVLSRAAGIALFEILSQSELLAVKDIILQNEEIAALNSKGNGMYSSALNNYIAFRATIDAPSFQSSESFPANSLLAEFESALDNCGFFSSKIDENE
jgi:hypothetical protein